MVRSNLTTEWKLAMVAALLSDNEAAADDMERAAAKFEDNPATHGIANMLRDRADDIRLALAQQRENRAAQALNSEFR